MADVEIKGLSELISAMRELPKALEAKVLRQAVGSGAILIRKTAQELVTRRTGLISKAIRIGFNKNESGPGKVVYHVFVSQKVKDKLKGKTVSAYYWRFLEFGTVKMAAKPFMRPAFDVSSRQALSVITNKLDSGIQKEAARLGKS